MNIKLDKNDKLFSIMIRERDNNKCVFCQRSGDQGYRMTNSHYWGRGDKVHRFDPLNCDTLCFMCHQTNEGNKQGFYRDFKIKQLGIKKHSEMERTHYQQTKKYGAYEKDYLYEILQRQYKNKEHLEANWQVNW